MDQTTFQWSNQTPNRPGVWAKKRQDAEGKWGDLQLLYFSKEHQCFENPHWVWDFHSQWVFVGEIPTFKIATDILLPCKACGKFPDPVKSLVYFAYNHHGIENHENGVSGHQISTVFRKTKIEADNDWNALNA